MVPTTLHINIIDAGRRFRVGQGVATEQFDPHLNVNVLYVTAVSVFRIKEKEIHSKKKNLNVYYFASFIRVLPSSLVGVQSSSWYVRHPKMTSKTH